MKIKLALLQRLAVNAALFALSASAARAATFTSSPQDLTLNFRQVGFATDLTIDVGQVSNYRGLSSSVSVPINAADITGTFGNLNNLL